MPGYDDFDTSGRGTGHCGWPGRTFEKAPSFKNKGFEKYWKWVLSRVQYPADMEEQKVEGVVQVRIIVETDGSVTVDEVLASPHEKLTEAVTRVVENSPKWTPGIIPTRSPVWIIPCGFLTFCPWSSRCVRKNWSIRPSDVITDRRISNLTVVDTLSASARYLVAGALPTGRFSAVTAGDA